MSYRKALYLKVCIAFMFAASIGLFSPVISASEQNQEGVTWEAAKMLMDDKLQQKNVPFSERCDIVWNTLWPWSKKGNYEARYLLAMDFMMQGRRMPGHYDWTSMIRDMNIISIHATGYSNKKYQDMDNSFYESLPKLDMIYGEYLSCAKQERSSKCIDLAVKNGMVPSFEDYANEIDLLIEQGEKSKCNGGLANHR